MSFSKSQILSQSHATGVIPVFYHKDLEVCRGVLKAAYDGGCRVFEFTNRGENAFDTFSDLLHYATYQLPGLMLGIGSILDGDTALKFIHAGAHFIVSPILDESMADVCRLEDKLWIPGCATLTEIVKATRLGADLVKIFPGSTLGPKFVSSVLAPIPSLKLMPTGGVEPSVQNMKEWFSAGVYCVGIGGNLFKKDWLEKGDFASVQAAIAQCIADAREVRAL